MHQPSASTSSMTRDRAANDVTDLLRAWGAGDAQASEAVVPLVYGELRRQAGLALRRENEGHTLQTTALVNEAWLRLDAQHDARWESRTQFFAVAAQIMRRILVDHARRRRARARHSWGRRSRGARAWDVRDGAIVTPSDRSSRARRRARAPRGVRSS